MAEKPENALSTEKNTSLVEAERDQLSAIHRMTTDIAQQLEKARIAEYTQLLNRPWKLIWTNLLAGSARGVGIAIGFTFCGNHHIRPSGAWRAEFAYYRRLHCGYCPDCSAAA